MFSAPAVGSPFQVNFIISLFMVLFLLFMERIEFLIKTEGILNTERTYYMINCYDWYFISTFDSQSM